MESRKGIEAVGRVGRGRVMRRQGGVRTRGVGGGEGLHEDAGEEAPLNSSREGARVRGIGGAAGVCLFKHPEQCVARMARHRPEEDAAGVPAFADMAEMAAGERLLVHLEQIAFETVGQRSVLQVFSEEIEPVE